MSLDLDDQLEAYGDWLQQTCGVDLVPPNRRIGGTRRDDDVESDQRTNRGHTRLRIAAALLVVAGIVGLVVAQRDADPSPVAAPYTSRLDPAAHLFVLPTDPQDLDVSRGDVSTVRPDDGDLPHRASTEVLVGTEIDGGFSNLVVVVVASALPEGFGVDGSTEIDTPTGPALLADDRLPFQRLAQRRGDSWLLMIGATGTQDLVDLLSQVTIDPSGSLAIRDDRRVIVGEPSRDPAAADYSTSYDIADPSSGVSYHVETATSPSALVLGAYTPDPVVPTTVHGTQAWVMSRDGDPPEGGTAIAWRATPNRIVVISARAPLDAVQAMAERLRQVTDREWLASLPDASIPD